MGPSVRKEDLALARHFCRRNGTRQAKEQRRHWTVAEGRKGGKGGEEGKEGENVKGM
jgi:hypothetical protein